MHRICLPPRHPICLQISVRESVKSWVPMEFILCSGSVLSAFRAQDTLYVGDETIAYTETVDIESEEVPVKGFPCNMALGSVVVTGRCARFLDDDEDRCLGRDVLSHFVLRHQTGKGVEILSAEG